MGDFNAKTGSDNVDRKHVMGREGLGQINENSELFADFYSFNNIVIGGRTKKSTECSWDHAWLAILEPI